MARGRRPKADPPVQWKVSIPQSLAVATMEYLKDPFLGEPLLGERSKLIEKLLRQYLKAQGVI